MLTILRRAVPVLALIACAGLSIPATAQTATKAPELAQAPLPAAHASTRLASKNAIEQRLATRDWSRKMWDAARTGDQSSFSALLDKAPNDASDPQLAAVRASALQLKANFDKRETDRAKRRDEVMAELDKTLAEPRTDITISKGLISVVELHMLATDKAVVLRDPKVSALLAEADKAAHAAEDRADWLTASELFYRLSAIFEDQGTYKTDSDRLNHRLEMLRLYAPERLWELRNARQTAGTVPPQPSPATTSARSSNC